MWILILLLILWRLKTEEERTRNPCYDMTYPAAKSDNPTTKSLKIKSLLLFLQKIIIVLRTHAEGGAAEKVDGYVPIFIQLNKSINIIIAQNEDIIVIIVCRSILIRDMLFMLPPSATPPLPQTPFPSVR